VQISRGLASVAAIALLNGCNKTAVKYPPRPVAASQSEAGVLPPSANDSTGTGYYDFIQTVRWVKKRPVSMCAESSFCWTGLSPKVTVDLDVAENSYLVDPRQVNAKGVVLVRAINNGDRPTQNYHFRPGYIYTLVAYPDSPGDNTSHWVLKETDARTHHTATVLSVHGPFTPCWDSPNPATEDDVDLANCGDKHYTATAYKSSIGSFGLMDALLAVVAAAASGDSPVWKSCPSGCCTLSQAE
jgi:hypothetical protein